MSIKLLIALGAVALLVLSVMIYLVGLLLKKAWTVILRIADKKSKE